MIELLIAACVGIGMTVFFYAIHCVREAIIRGVEDLDDTDWMR
jgi:hypothetical protein